MKTNELMCQDWVLVGDAPYRIKEIDYDENVVRYYTPDEEEAQEGMTGLYAPVQELGRIPITPEVLKKSDFEETVDCWFLRWCDEDVWIYEWSESIWVIRYEDTEMNTPVEQLVVAYVHELQHALRHFGIDKVVRV